MDHWSWEERKEIPKEKPLTPEQQDRYDETGAVGLSG